MTPRLWIVGIIIGLSVTAGMGCHGSARTPPSATASDSLTGIVSVTGTAFEQRLTVRSGDATTYLSAATADSLALTRLGGVEVVIVGKRAPKMFRVQSFTALRVNGSPVVDGIVKTEGDKLVLETKYGRFVLGNPPQALRRMVSARIWIAGPLDKGPNSYGLIAPAP